MVRGKLREGKLVQDRRRLAKAGPDDYCCYFATFVCPSGLELVYIRPGIPPNRNFWELLSGYFYGLFALPVAHPAVSKH